MLSLGLLAGLAGAPFALVISAVRYYTVGNPAYQDSIQATLRRTLKADLLRWLTGWRTLDDVRLLNKPMPQALGKMKGPYVAVAGWLKPYGDRLYWFVHQEGAKRVMVYLHGGAYVSQIVALQAAATLAVWWNLDEKTRSTTNVVALDYTLTLDGGEHPTPLNELKALYRDLVRDGYDEIILMGDSAGGHLALAYLRDMDPDLPQPAGIAVQAPWIYVSSPRVGSIVTNAVTDLVPYEPLKMLGALFYGKQNPDVVNHNSVGSWDHADVVAQNRMLVLVGESEILRDQVVDWCNDVGVDYEEEPRGVHATWAWVETIGHEDPRDTRDEWAVSRMVKYVSAVARRGRL